MKIGMRTLGVCVAALVGLGPFAGNAAPNTVVEAEVARLATQVDGTVGVSAWRLDGSGAQVHLNPDERFPMASTFKVAVAAAVLAKVDAGTLALSTMVDVPMALHVESEVIAERFIHDGVRLSVHNLIEVMLTQSDNTATDVLVAQAGGPEAITAWLRSHGVEGQRIDRDTRRLLMDFHGLPDIGPLSKANLMEMAVRHPELAARVGKSDNAEFNADPRDTSTPRAMSTLLTRLFRGEVLSADSTATLVAVMERCRTCSDRLRGRMPKGTVVADKSGTLGGTVNDVGVVTLPDGGQFAISVFVKGSTAPRSDRERVIAEIARTVRDFYLFAPATPAPAP